MPVYQLDDHVPDISPNAFIAENAVIIGRVKIETNCSVWYNATIRGDNEPIRIGENSNVQEGCVLHTDPGFPLNIANNVSIGHQAMLHGCSIGEGSLIGIQAIILNGAKIGRNCLVGAGALVTEGKEFPDNSLIVGTPAKAIRTLSPDAISGMHSVAADYAGKSQTYQQRLRLIDVLEPDAVNNATLPPK